MPTQAEESLNVDLLFTAYRSLKIDNRRNLGPHPDWDNLLGIRGRNRNFRLPRLRKAFRLDRGIELNFAPSSDGSW